MRWKGANEVTVSTQIVELRLGTIVYFVLWHWCGQAWVLVGKFPTIATVFNVSSNLAHGLLLITPYSAVSHPLDKAYELFQESAMSTEQQSTAVLAAPFPLPLLLFTWHQPCPVPHPSRMEQQTQPHIHAPPQPDNFLHSYKTCKYLSHQWALMYSCMVLDIWTYVNQICFFCNKINLCTPITFLIFKKKLYIVK